MASRDIVRKRFGEALATPAVGRTAHIQTASAGDPALRAEVERQTLALKAMTLAFRPDSKHLTSGSRDQTLKIWNTTRWEESPDH